LLLGEHAVLDSGHSSIYAAPMAQAPRPPVSLRDMILSRVSFLVTATTFLVGAGFVLFGLLPMADRIAGDQLNSAAARVEAGLAAVFSPPTSLLEMSRGWLAGEAPDLETPEAFNQLFKPLLESSPQITSVVAGSSTGQGWLLLQQADGSWRNRMTDIPRWGERHLLIDHFAEGRTSRYWETRRYDARQRPWFEIALAGGNDLGVHWTAPYTFFTTGDPGMTVSTLIRLKDGRDFVLGFDLMLRDLSQSTLHASVGKQGLALVVTDDARVLAMPAAPDSVNETEWLQHILKPVDDLGLKPVSAALATWQRAGRTGDGVLSYESGGTHWLASIRPYPLGSQRFWVMTLAPAADFSPDWGPIISALTAALALALTIALLISRAEARRLARPLESLALASGQMSRLDFQGAAPVDSRITEIRQLASAQDAMRAVLHSHQQVLADQAEHLRQQISALLAAEEEIKYLAFYDALTHLPNRRLLQDRLQQAFAASERSGRAGALLFIDVDNFKTLNDTRGHEVGDQLLVKIAQRLRTCVRQGDTVARLGGDEFVAMLEDLGEQPQDAAEQARSIGEKMLRLLNQPFELGSHAYHSSVSMGITLISGRQHSIDDLLRRADLAMYQAKAAGRNTLRFFDPEMQAVVSARALLEAELRQGLRQKEFVLYYQAQVDARGCLAGLPHSPIIF
jgi:diguanylate cyclase (GGDEF)-like protein